LWTGSWNHAEDAVPQKRVTAKRPGRVRDSDTPQRDEPGAFNVHARICAGAWVGDHPGLPGPRIVSPEPAQNLEPIMYCVPRTCAIRRP
jgi:hypothetical protein